MDLKAWIIGRRNGAGLEQDAFLLGRALCEGGRTVDYRMPREWGVLLNPWLRAEVAFHLERAFPLWRWKARVHLLIPNQERFPKRHLGRLKFIDHILCKSRHAALIFSELHPSVHFIGFTSPDRILPEVTPDYSRFFHLAGRSTLKGTAVLLELWSKHPEWPELTLVQHPSNAPAAVPPNVRLISRHIPETELRLLQNSCGVHLCPSLSEGWGHYIVEAMSCRAVTVTTDGPPMNEVVRPERGVLVSANRSERRQLGMNYYVDPIALEQAVLTLVATSASDKGRMGAVARAWFEENDRMFGPRLERVIKSL